MIYVAEVMFETVFNDHVKSPLSDLRLEPEKNMLKAINDCCVTV